MVRAVVNTLLRADAEAKQEELRLMVGCVNIAVVVHSGYSDAS